jgi:hypothetical protein
MRRMPQSGISAQDAATILDYLTGLGNRAPRSAVLGGRDAWGPEWLSILETAAIRDGHVRLGGEEYDAEVQGVAVTLRHLQTHEVSLTAEGLPGKTSILDRWAIGSATYELHLILYDIRGERVRCGLALRK